MLICTLLDLLWSIMELLDWTVLVLGISSILDLGIVQSPVIFILDSVSDSLSPYDFWDFFIFWCVLDAEIDLFLLFWFWLLIESSKFWFSLKLPAHNYFLISY